MTRMVIWVLFLAAGCSNGGNSQQDSTPGAGIEDSIDVAADGAGSTDAAISLDSADVPGVPDDSADALDAVEPDVSIDCSPPQPGPHAMFCLLDCDSHEACGEGAMCLQFQNSDRMFCATAPLADGPQCPYGSYVADVDGQDVCVPYTPDCDRALLGMDCDGELLAGVCKNEAHHCTSTDWRPGYCTVECESDADCPGAFPDCTPTGDPCQAAHLCRATWEKGPEGCGVAPGDAQGDGAPCRGNDDCAAGQVCLFAENSPPRPFCTTTCMDDGGCAVGSTCEPTGHGIYCLPPSCACLADADTMYAQVLELLGLDPCAALFVRKWLMVWPPALSHDDWRLRHFHEIHDYPPHALPAVRKDIAEIDAPEFSSPLRVAGEIEKGARMLDRPVDMALLEIVAPEPDDTVADLIAEFAKAAGGSATGDLGALEDLPEDLAGPLLQLLPAMTAALKARAAISEQLADDKLEGYLFDLAYGYVALHKSFFALPPTQAAVKDALTGRTFDFPRLSSAGMYLAQAAESFLPAAGNSWTGFSVTIETPAGLIVISDGADHTYDPAELGTSAIALLVDTGGNDTYLIPAGANASLDNPVSILIDLGGDDIYGYVESGASPDPLLLAPDADGRWDPTGPPNETNGPFSLSDVNRQGAGRMGIGMLFDLGGGEDIYTSLRISQGFGVLGIGVLYDDGGNDLYQAEAAAQGAGVFGIGILMDDGGNDDYTTYHCSQGFAYALGYGLLYDDSGDDSYIAHRGDPELGGYPLYFNPQNPGKSNSSMSQGFGFGRRADFTDGVFMSGGFGTLRDRDGNDVYEVDIFGQGAGYWFGTGILADGGGSDSYGGRWYVLGAGAHYATGIFIEEGGDDTYSADLPLMNASLGLGHDWSLGVFADEAGDDTYYAPSLSVGAGNADGFGYFLDIEGDDEYHSTANNTFGFANAGDYGGYPAFSDFDCLGVFLDAAGSDTYDRPDPALLVNDTTWATPPPHPDFGSMEIGGGMDSQGISTGM